MVALAGGYRRYGHRRVAALLRAEGLVVDTKRPERLWRGEGLGVPAKRPERGGSGWTTARASARDPSGRDHVRSCDLAQARTRDGRAFRMLDVIDESTRGCPAIDAARGLTGDDVPGRPPDLLPRRGVPDHIRGDDGPGSTAKAVRGWLGRAGVEAPFLEPGSPRESGHIESSNGELSDELPDGETLDTLPEAEALIERYRVRSSTVRPHGSPGHRPPARGRPCRGRRASGLRSFARHLRPERS